MISVMDGIHCGSSAAEHNHLTKHTTLLSSTASQAQHNPLGPPSSNFPSPPIIDLSKKYEEGRSILLIQFCRPRRTINNKSIHLAPPWRFYQLPPRLPTTTPHHHNNIIYLGSRRVKKVLPNTKYQTKFWKKENRMIMRS